MVLENNLIIADDHPLIIKGVMAEIQNLENYKIVGVADNGNDALKLIRYTVPHIAILDLQMPHMNGLEVLEQVKKEKLSTHIIILTMYKDIQLHEKAKRLGASGYLLKDTVLEEIKLCLDTITRGSKYLSNSLEVLMSNEEKEFPGLSLLSRMERKIFLLIKSSKTSKEIAEELFLSEKTIENHRYNISKKFNLPAEKNALMKFILKAYDRY
jgi:two-component system, NarL family, nitrate/nitrite response regulator NarL